MISFLKRLSLLLLCASSALAAEKKPNIIFILMDDMGFSDVSCYGAETVETPNIDRLAAEGLKFNNFHSGASICSPSRAAFLTGAYPQRCGLYMGINENREPHWFLGLNPDEITLAELCQEQGYKTLMVGKWHLGVAEEFSYYNQGFESYYGAPSNMGHNPEFFDEKEEVYAKTPLEKLAGLYTAKVVEHVRNHKDTPFFLYYSHQYPHTPYAASEKWKGTSKSGARGDSLQEVDWGIGEMIKALEEEGILDNTLIIFTSDNGATSNKFCVPFRGTKYVTLEGGHRVPFILYHSKIQEAREVETFTTAMDLFPTIAELIGAEMPSDRVFDGVSLLPLFTGGDIARAADEPFFYYNACNLQAVKQGKWKLHLPRDKNESPWWDKSKEYVGISAPVLYDLTADVNERQDVAADHPEVVEQLVALATEKKKEFGQHMERGSAQRATGSLFPEVPVITHPRDWEPLSDEEKGRAKTEFKSHKVGKKKKKSKQ